MAKKKTAQFKLAIAGVTTEQFSVTPEHVEAKEKVDLMLSFNFKQSEQQQLIGVFLTVTFHQEKRNLILLEVGCHFRIHPQTWDELVRNENGNLVLPHAHALHLATVTTGTARGVLHARLTNSPFAHYVLPAVNLLEILKSDIELNTSKTSE